ncbi:hypothetical protein MLD38_001862 [Melastoma candidum]|uniref:Uncharacterized protein n=1 Tax=Melastoma candidum TaxID=119954 RepID=A0ACB9SHW0_9MYRT|nr:hypothetical protein MLD38_001862 [Melastoma candidum]
MEFHPVPSPSSSSSGFQLLNSSSSSSSSPFGDTTHTKVFVGGLAWETQNETLRQFFEPFGEILEAVVIADKNTGRSKGYGFVTFREPESARKACVDPTPVIDGRRANCNLASQGRPRLPAALGRLRPSALYIGGAQPPRGNFVGNYGYQHPLYYSYQQGYIYPTYGYSTYGQEHVYPQGVYSPYISQQYLQMYGMQNAINSNTGVYPYTSAGQNMPRGGHHGYAPIAGYTMTGHPIVQFGAPSIEALSTSPMPAVQASYPPVSGLASGYSTRPQIIIPVASTQFLQGGSSDRSQVYLKCLIYGGGLRSAGGLLSVAGFFYLAFENLSLLHSRGHTTSVLRAAETPVTSNEDAPDRQGVGGSSSVAILPLSFPRTILKTAQQRFLRVLLSRVHGSWIPGNGPRVFMV